MTSGGSVVFLIDVDNTLLDNDRAQNDYLWHIKQNLGGHAAERYWSIFEELTHELGYADYLGALQRYRLEDLHDPHLLLMSSFLLDYPFQDRLYSQSLDVLKRLGELGPTVVSPLLILRICSTTISRLKGGMARDYKHKLAWTIADEAVQVGDAMAAWRAARFSSDAAVAQIALGRCPRSNGAGTSSIQRRENLRGLPWR